jgi:hypothetical protein
VLNDLRVIVATTLVLVVGRVPHWLGVEHRLKMSPLPHPAASRHQA